MWDDRANTVRNFRIVAELEAVAHEADRPMAQVALNWLHQKRGVSSIIIGNKFTIGSDAFSRSLDIDNTARRFSHE